MPTGLEFWLRAGVETLTMFFLAIGAAGLIVPIFPGFVNWYQYYNWGCNN
jgi:hypothetical protein